MKKILSALIVASSMLCASAFAQVPVIRHDVHPGVHHQVHKAPKHHAYKHHAQRHHRHHAQKHHARPRHYAHGVRHPHAPHHGARH